MGDKWDIIYNFKGEIYDLCYELLRDAESEVEVFQYVCENLTSLPEDGQIEIEKRFSEDEINELRAAYGDIVDGLIKSTIKRCDYGMVQENMFYEILWTSYGAHFVTLEEKAFAFYYTIIDKRIPYMYIGKPLSMDQKRFMEIQEENEKLLDKIGYIFSSSYTQKTEVASLVLQCLDKVEDFEIKVIALIRAMDLHKIKSQKESVDVASLIKDIEQKIKELEQE